MRGFRVKCPKCGAEPGEACVSLDQQHRPLADPHYDRVLARKAAREGGQQ